MEMIDAYAVAAAISLGTLAALHLLAWRGQHQRWYVSFGISYLVATLIYAFDPLTRPIGERPNPYATAMALPALILLVDGMVDYVGLTGRVARRLRVGAIVMGVVYGAVALPGIVQRLAGFVMLSSFLAAVALLALWAMRREPRSGHGLVFMASMLYPGVVLAAGLGWIPVILLRYAVAVPLTVTGMTMLTTSLMRARRRADQELHRATEAEAAVRELNESLEHRVAERTAELRDMVTGLEGFNRHVSHDLRGPLGGIAGAARLADQALQRGDSAFAGRVLPVIAQQAESAVQLLAALLSLARVSDAKMTPQRLALDALVQETLAQLRSTHPESATVPVTIHSPLPDVEADPALLRQVYVNLVGNAIKFAGASGAPQVEVGAEQQSGEAVFYVRDNGVGFDNAKAQQLFEPFQRLHGAAYPGHGVGLSIVKRIVQRHGGRVWAHGAPGQGATFFFTLGGPR